MRRTLGLVVTCAGALTLGFPVQAEPLKPSDEAERTSLSYAVTAPLRDVNIMRSKIPAVLQGAYADPYRRPTPSSCSGIIGEVEQLNAALGHDLDADNLKSVSMQGRAKEETLSAIAGLASDVIPFRGWVRKLSGAENHDRLVQKSIAAGAVRRAYLKGLGEARGCNPPGTPLHKPTEAPVLTRNDITAVPAAPDGPAAGLTKTSGPYPAD